MYTCTLYAMLFSNVINAGIITERQSPPAQSVWKSPDGGSTSVRFGDEYVYVGSCTPKMIIDSLYDNCYGEGFCNPNSWSMQCLFDDGGTHTITVSAPEGQFQPWLKNGLVEAMNVAIATPKVTSSKEYTAASGGGCVGCPWTAQKFTGYTMPNAIGISRANDAGRVPDVITIKIENDKTERDSGLCEVLTGLGSGVAGAVNGAAGGIFQVGSVACKAI